MSRLDDCLIGGRVCFVKSWHPPAFTAPRRAHFARVPGRTMAKAILVLSADRPILVLIPADAMLHIDGMQQQLRSPIRLASRRQIATLFPGCGHGVVPGLGSPWGIATAIDQSLLDEPAILVPSARNDMDYKMTPADFCQVEKPIVGSFLHGAKPARRPHFLDRARVPSDPNAN